MEPVRWIRIHPTAEEPEFTLAVHMVGLIPSS